MDRSQPFQPETVDNAHNVMSVFEYLLMLRNDILDLEVAAAMEAADRDRGPAAAAAVAAAVADATVAI
jgi:hypothetical protein